MSGAAEKTETNRNRAVNAARCLTAACEPLEHRRLLSAYGPLVSVSSFNVSPNGVYPHSAVTFDPSGNLWGTTVQGGSSNDGTVFEIANGSSTITTVANFHGSNGADPHAGVTFDTSGNLWGTTYNGGSGSVGTVFEITKGSSTITTVASFNTSNGAHPMAGVAFDSSGNLWGTTYNGGSGSYGTIFEIVKGSTTITTAITDFGNLGGTNPESAVSFDPNGNLWVTTQSGGNSGNGTVDEYNKGGGGSGFTVFLSSTSGTNPQGAVTFDSSGNGWGTTSAGGSSNGGTVFEAINASSAIRPVANLNTSTGTNSVTAVTFDTSGNLWGTSTAGGASNDGTIFEIAAGSNSITNVVSFNGANGGSPEGSVTFDSNGNLWGTTYVGGIANVGTVFEIAKGGNTITMIASFIGTNGSLPRAGVTFDSSGNLWGTTRNGGPNDDGTVFEVVKGSSTVTTIASFNGINGQHPDDAVTFDSVGNLWGTTYQAGTGGWGTVFDITAGSDTITTVVNFNNMNGAWPTSGVTFDSSGNLWGTTNGAGQGGSAPSVYEIAKGSSTVNTVTYLNGYVASGVTFDASGNLWCTTSYNGTSSDGTVNEILKGTTTPTIVANFNASTGGNPILAGVTFDASGNLWGTTTLAGAYGTTAGEGTVYEILKGSKTITAVVSFNSSGGSPQRGVTFDSSGNLWGTTYNGGTGSFGTIFEIAKGTTTATTIATFNGSNGANPIDPVTFDSSGNVWGTANTGGVANAGNVWELSLKPTWLSDPAGNDTWNTASHTLMVNDPSTIIADPGTDQPIIQASGASAVVTINPSSALQIHLGGLSLTNGASAIVTSLGAARTATNYRVLVLGQAGATTAPLFNIDATSKLDLTDNDLVDHGGSLSGVTGLLASGFTNGWTGNGIDSSKAAASTIYALGISQPPSAGIFDNETVGTSDVEIRYTYFGDADLDGQVDGSDYSKIDSGFLNQSTGWSNGDFNYDGVINGSDYTLIDNAFNTQGASLAALIAPSLDIRGKTSGRSPTASFAPRIFSTQTLNPLTESPEQSIEVSIHKRDLLDQLSLAV